MTKPTITKQAAAVHLRIASLVHMERCAAAFARLLPEVRRVYLRGEIGVGKTAFVAGVLRAMGHSGAVKSPTFTFMEPYVVAGRSVYHVDLYRLERPEDVEFLGLGDYLEEGIAFVEWPERGSGFIPVADIDLRIQSIDDVREMIFSGISNLGTETLIAFAQQLPEWQGHPV